MVVAIFIWTLHYLESLFGPKFNVPYCDRPSAENVNPSKYMSDMKQCFSAVRRRLGTRWTPQIGRARPKFMSAVTMRQRQWRICSIQSQFPKTFYDLKHGKYIVKYHFGSLAVDYALIKTLMKKIKLCGAKWRLALISIDRDESI